jgi:DNA-binding NarL/FixJ family response regulator
MNFLETGVLPLEAPWPRQDGLETALVRILVVDDFLPFRSFTVSALRKRPGFRVVEEAFDGEEAVQKANELKPDLVVLDIGLPVLNGIEAARRIRSVSPDSKIVFLTCNSSPDIAREAFNAGGVGYVVKHDAAGELIAAVEAVLQGRRYVSKQLDGRGVIEEL